MKDHGLIEKPSDKEVAMFGGNGRRQFLEYLGATGLAALAAACTKGGSGGSSGNPVGGSSLESTVSGEVRRTSDLGAMSQGYRVMFGSEEATPNGGRYSVKVMPGTYEVAIDGSGVVIPRRRLNVRVNGDANIDFYAIGPADSFNVDHNEAMTRGGYRFIASPKVFIVKRADGSPVPQSYIDATLSSIDLTNDILSGLLDIGSQIVESEPQEKPEGTIIGTYKSGGAHGGPDTANGTRILTASFNNPQGRYENLRTAILHEFWHSLGFNHTSKGVMQQKEPLPYPDGDDKNSVKYKYSRNPGAGIINDIDTD